MNYRNFRKFYLATAVGAYIENFVGKASRLRDSEPLDVYLYGCSWSDAPFLEYARDVVVGSDTPDYAEASNHINTMCLELLPKVLLGSPRDYLTTHAVSRLEEMGIGLDGRVLRTFAASTCRDLRIEGDSFHDINMHFANEFFASEPDDTPEEDVMVFDSTNVRETVLAFAKYAGISRQPTINSMVKRFLKDYKI
jgi:hypothetical protein